MSSHRNNNTRYLGCRTNFAVLAACLALEGLGAFLEQLKGAVEGDKPSLSFLNQVSDK